MSAIHGQRLGFGAGGIFRGADPARLLDLAQSADELGFDLFSLSDHLHTDQPTLEPWTALSWLAAKTERIALGTNVLGLPYRAPAVLAKSAETLDRLSGGRLVLGLGAGGYDREFEAFGLPVRTPGRKITAQREAIRIIHGLWAGEPEVFDGREFSVREARIEPRPEHRIPLWLGTYGPRALELTGQLADGWLPSFGRIDLPRAIEMRDVVRKAAADAGRDPGSITCAANLTVRVDPAQTSYPGLVTGSVAEVVRQITEVVRAGFTFLLLGPQSVAEQELLAREVLPAVRAAAGG
ncbi:MULTISPECIES: LLM class flavin-dependent oxidoreductase [unclassified Amycolatopsis]|uniref:LLM class flavin-dependent oxidoreductase n=1 Tax=unclassified Amycolatopsis TaxID=2618356 RepID=UPI0028765D4B|nr:MULTISPECIES: LLM class flavin-dependent oxidoreductase [unclassified Amycolatopsis]MDS0135831.1 LLM class flavin-dependent oxidoreductase [Amycolatopsis sp. 505]MDS0145568.1 LLM class flavin-dependent oxidoreductase [Amycolatopsis sp. CM201R]